ncbi:nuclear transport factor 2 family protein [Azospirillum lipoferum]|uniref:Nuclear transport factor 2 family protein n=2 Tax=Azospirillaceae TaxID=2829815 RepID=A0A5A9G4E7_AZOLI|nr:nuclear transport factor 2 family protein [Azospirillum lipoferum]
MAVPRVRPGREQLSETSMKYEDYLAAYNLGDDARLIDTFFHPDAVIDGPDQSFATSADFLRMLQFVHHGVVETLTPLAVLESQDLIIAELNATFTARIERLDFPFASLGPGDNLTMRFFARYHLRAGKVARMSLACWLPAMRGLPAA